MNFNAMLQRSLQVVDPNVRITTNPDAFSRTTGEIQAERLALCQSLSEVEAARKESMEYAALSSTQW